MIICAPLPRMSRAERRKAAGFMRLEIADCRSRKKADLRHAGDLYRQRERRGEIGGDRVDGKRREILAQGACLRVRKSPEISTGT